MTDDVPRKVAISRTEILLDDFFRVEAAWVSHERFQPPGGMNPEKRWLNLDRGDSAAAVLHDGERGVVVLVRQFRYPTHANGDGWLLELVAGMCDGEDPEETVRREVLEEVGWEVTDVERIAVFYASPGGSNERIFLYYAPLDGRARSGEGGGASHEGEDIQTVELSVEEAFERLDRGRFRDAKTILGLQWLRRRLERPAR